MGEWLPVIEWLHRHGFGDPGVLFVLVLLWRRVSRLSSKLHEVVGRLDGHVEAARDVGIPRGVIELPRKVARWTSAKS